MAKRVYGTRAKNSAAHPGTPDMPALRRSSAQIAEERRLKALQEEEVAALQRSLKLQVARLEVRNQQLEALATAPSAPAPNAAKGRRGRQTPAAAKATAPANMSMEETPAPKTPVSIVRHTNETVLTGFPTPSGSRAWFKAQPSKCQRRRPGCQC